MWTKPFRIETFEQTRRERDGLQMHESDDVPFGRRLNFDSECTQMSNEIEHIYQAHTRTRTYFHISNNKMECRTRVSSIQIQIISLPSSR